MANQYEHDEAVRRAKGMLGGGFDAQYLYEKFVSEKYGEDEAAAIVQEATGKPFRKPIKTESKPSEPLAQSPVETPLSVATTIETPTTQTDEKAEDAPVSLASLLESPKAQASSGDEESISELLETLDDKLEAAQEEASSNPLPEESSPEPAVVSSPASTKQETSNSIHSSFRLQEAKNHAASLFDSGYGTEYIKNKLLGRGFTPEQVNAALATLKGKNSYMQTASSKTKADYRYTPQESGATDGSAQIIIGIVMILLGCAVTFFSYEAAANSASGGSYIVTFGLIIAGAIRVFKGLSNS